MVSRAVGWAAVTAAAALVLGMATPAHAAGRRVPPPLLTGARSRPVAGHTAGPVRVPPPAVDGRVRRTPPATAWPAGGSADVVAGSARPVPVGGLPVAVRPVRPGTPAAGAPATRPGTGPGRGPGRVRVSVVDRAAAARAGVPGVLLRLAPSGSAAAGRVQLTVGYAAFRDSYGGDWAARLALQRLPACALAGPRPAGSHPAGPRPAGPRPAGCRPEPLASRNDPAAGTVSAAVDLPAAGAVLALTAGASGSTGDYTATSLAPSASWEVSEASGDFSWRYPLRMPPVPGNLQPSLALAYSSGAVDGRTASTNSQPSAVGEGWDVWPGYVERRYRACSDDGKPTSDLCWGPDNATLVLGGRAVPLVSDDGGYGWRPRSDDGSRIEHLTGAANGANGGEWWRVTTVDGTQYWFGRNQLPGFVAGRQQTGSAWTVPVFGNGDGEPCHAAPGWCQQAWRWNLDYVVDPHGDAVAYYYTPETNSYALDGGPAAQPYTRGGYLEHIDYGFRDGHAYDAGAAATVAFGTADRCDPASSGCGSWPDTPTDQACSAATCTASQLAPTFWSRKRLTTITTRVLRSGGYSDVDQWTLDQSFPEPGDGQSAALWLRSIIHTGLAGGSTDVPPVTFDITPLQNRVRTATYPGMVKMRVGTIRTETGGVVQVTYAPQDCTPSSLPVAPDSDTRRCFAQWWAPFHEPPILDWFHKYVVARVTESDPIGGSAPAQTDYGYFDGAAWHYADADEITPAAKRTWSQWRGYARVEVRHGSATEGQSLAEKRFYRGMDGDHQSSGPPRSASVTDSRGGTVPDADGLAGQPREQTVYNGPGGAEVSGTIYDPYRSAPTATHAHDGLTVAAYRVRPGAEHGRVDLTPGGLRRTELDRGYDADGRLTDVDDQGDAATAADDRCTTTGYAADRDRWLLAYPSKVTTVAKRCDAPPAYPADGISEQRMYYDGSTTLGELTGAGDATRTEIAKAYGSGGPSAFAATGARYDGYGRVLHATDPIGRAADTVYTGVPATRVAVTNAAGFSTTTTLDPAWGEALSTVDTNGRRTDLAYDPLGRLTAVWLPDRPKAGNSTGNLQFGYQLSNSGPSWVRTDKLAPSSLYLTSYLLYDGLLRQRQAQQPAEGGGRLVTDTFYNTRGLPYLVFNPYFTGGAPAAGLFSTTPTQVPNETVTSYDGAGRPATVDTRRYDSELLWRTATAYRGNHVDVTPPAGGTATGTYTDARGRTTELRQYRGATPDGGYDATRYGYTPAGKLASITDPAGIGWSYGYDVLGRQTSATGPDTGRSTMTYDDAGQLLTGTDSRGQRLAYSYDQLGRKTGVYLDSTAGTRLAGWTYDTVPDPTTTSGVVKGQPASSTRYEGGNAYTVAVTGYDVDYRPTGRDVTIPAAETGLAGTYSTGAGYAIDGSPASQTLPAAGGLPAETVRTGYDAIGLPYSLKGRQDYVVDSQYTSYGEPSVYTMFTGTGPAVQLSYDFEDGTRRLARTMLVRQTSTDRTQSDLHYGYDQAGDVTKVADTPAGHPADTQCFDYDHLRRLTEAWTPASGDCTAAPTAAAGVLSGPAPYWTSYRYDVTGNRTAETRHDPAGDPTRDTALTYAYPDPSAAQPHTLQSVTSTGPGGSHTDGYGYDAAGDTTSRGLPGHSQALDWDTEGHLHAVTEGTGRSTYTYDADGNRLVQRDPAGSTLYLPDGTELRYNLSTRSTTGIRYYTHNGTVVAVRTAAGVTWLATDPHGTASFAVTATTGAVAARRTDPFGNVRGPAPASWPDSHGFLGKPVDPGTGLSHLGARDYDPTLGRFTSADPVTDPADPQQLNGYAYANNNPTTNSDPTGRCAKCWDDDPGQPTPPPKSWSDSDGSAAGWESNGPASHGALSGAAGARPRDAGPRAWAPGSLPPQWTALADKAWGRTALDELIARLDEISAESTSNDDFIRRIADELAGLNPGRLPIGLGTGEGPHRTDPTRAILGASGWRPELIDNDNSPARHFIGFLAAAYFHGPDAATFGLYRNERPGQQGASQQDVRSGGRAILAGWFFHAGNWDRNTLIHQVIPALVGDRDYDGHARAPEPTQTPLVCPVLPWRC